MNRYRGIGKYESILKNIFKVEDTRELRGADWEGCLGVACVLSYMEGVPSSIDKMSDYLEIPSYSRSLINAIDRLRMNGIFSISYNAKNDDLLMGKYTNKSNKFISSKHLSEVAWGIIAGVASGYIGIN